MLHFAYDGTINGDWASHYALRLATHHPGRALRLIHVDEGRLPRDELAARLRGFEARCRALGLRFEASVLPLGRGVQAELAAHVPPGPDSYLVCATRAQPRGLGFLTGSVAERLLQARRWNVLALRVVQPGVLGHPLRLLIPVAGAPEGIVPGLPYLRLFEPESSAMHLLLVDEVAAWRLRRMPYERVRRRVERAAETIRRIEAQLRAGLKLDRIHLDAEATVSADVPGEIAVCANRQKSELIYVGASRRTWRERLLRGNPLERLLREAPCDVAIHGGCA
jgi:nucleotide-binding universal stress UspA family protein